MADKVNTGQTASYNFLPRFYRTDANKKFIQATVDQLVQSGTVKKINGYIGRQNSKATIGTDLFITAPSATRQNYQLEPGLVINDTLGNTTFFKDYQDYINQLGVFGANTSNHAILNSQEFYSWNPHIDWDKFVNFQNYYWLPNGPSAIKIAGQQQAIESTYKVSLESELNTYEYVFTPNGLSRNPTLTLFRGQTYNFEIDSIGQPFSIKTKRSSGSLDRYHTFDFNQYAVESGTLTITIPFDSPDVLYYVSESDIDVGGVIQVLSIEENTAINVDEEIIGKKTYKLPSGENLTNGMLVYFIGHVTPEKYSSGRYFVEGVGKSITLINEKELELISSYTLTESVLFDSTTFDSLPFSDATALASSVDYHVINRASIDKNPWTRYNRWFHKDCIELSAKINGQIASLDQKKRAVRPIIEFEAGLKLFNFGTKAIADVDLVDNYTTDVFSTIEGTVGYNIDGIPLANGQRILFTADTDSLVQNKIFRVEFLDVLHLNNGSRQIHLVLETEPTEGDTILVKDGKINKGLSYWFSGSEWNSAQQKYITNQSPLFDLVDNNAVSFADTSVYVGSTFSGTKLFSYRQGTGTVDTNLGFALSYKNINNVGDIVFDFNILSDVFQYKEITTIIDKNTNTGYLTAVSPLTGEISYTNGWENAVVTNTQAAIRIYKNSNQTNNFEIDIFDSVSDLEDLAVKIYVNGIRLDKSMWSIIDHVDYKVVVLDSDISLTDVLTIKAYARQPINSKGYYEIPINLQNNPLNGSLNDFTLGEVIDHVNSIVDNLENFKGIFPGASNLRDLGNVAAFGTKFVQHSGPLGLSIYHVAGETSNVIRAIEQSRDDYTAFKRNFVNVIDTLGLEYISDAVSHVNAILKELNKDKSKTGPYYFTDMIGCSSYIVNNYTVIDYRIKTYPVSKIFDLVELSSRAVYVYINGLQLIYGKEYTFSNQGFVVISAELNNDDVVTVYEYESTDGCFIPATPTKLGIWPKYEPKIYLDTTLLTPRLMIQGHDGSQILAYGDYRDELILELEKRIFNNIKVEYNPEIFDIISLLPSYVRETDYDLKTFNELLSPQFYKWTSLVDRDFTKPLSFDNTNPLTFNYRDYVAPDGRKLPGYWRGIYRWMYDTDRPNIAPWEMLGLTLEPSWWQDVYGPAPYTSNNLVMWQDLGNGLLKEPGMPAVQLKKYVRPFLMDHIPVNELGEIANPIATGIALPPLVQSIRSDFIFGDVSPVESAWRRNSHYPFSFIITSILCKPAQVFGLLLDRSRLIRNLTGQVIYKDTGLRVTPYDIVLPSIYSNADRVQTSGLINYIVDYILKDNLKSYSNYLYDLNNITTQLSYRLGAFTSKEKFNLLLDSRSPASSGSVFVPPEDYKIFLNSSSPVKKVVYSGVIITKLSGGYEVKGYSKLQPFFKYYPWIQSGSEINVGGISESYTLWSAGSLYTVRKIVLHNGKFYRVKAGHTSAAVFDIQYYQALASLPINGGQNAVTRLLWDREEPITVPYGTVFRTIQETYDFLVGYGEYLKDQGFIFDDFNNNLNAITNWNTSAKEFLFWTTQNWSSSQDKWEEWNPNTKTDYQAIVRYNGEYYQALRTIAATNIFNPNDYNKLDGLSTVGSAVITLSPAASKLSFSTDLCVVEDIRNSFNGYEIYKVDGSPLQDSFIDSYREDNAVSYSPRGTDGIFGATFYLLQKEQVVILNNSTIFGDTIYNQESGYRQERIKVSGYVTIDWKGSFSAPGFVFDQAKLNDWQPWTDYALGEVVKYKEYYYSASIAILGTPTFEPANWIRLSAKPEPKLLPNWNYKASQFEDFYSLDSDNFDSGQQKMAQHLVGYQKRQYLENIIQNDVSEFKFYQGMIIEKGTQNVLNKLFDVLSAESQESLDFYEEWAVRVGQYGANAAFENIEFILDESSFKNNPQGFELVNTIDPANIDFIIRQTPNDIYLKPLGYNNNPWPVVSNYIPYLRTPGFVRSSEVKTVLKTIEDILLEDVSNYSNGNYVWVGFEGREWNVYRYTYYESKITNATYTANSTTLTLEMDNLVTLPAGSYIAVENVAWQSFFKIASVSNNVITINSVVTPWATITDTSSLRVFSLTSQLVDSIDDVDSIVSKNRLLGELLWTKNSGNGKWATWKYNNIYSSSELINALPIADSLFGRTVSVDQTGRIAVVSNNTGQAFLYAKAVPGVPWSRQQIFPVPLIALSVGGTNPNELSWNNEVSAVSPDGTWIAFGSPKTGNASTNYRGTYNNSVTYSVGDIVKDTLDNNLYKALVSTSSQPSTHLSSWKKVTLIETSTTATRVGPTAQGTVTIYERNSIGLYSLVSTFTSPAPVQDEHFGSTLVFGDNNLLFITAANDTGKVYQLDYATRVQATAFYNPVGSSGITIKLDSTTGIEVGMYVSGIGFTAGQQVLDVVNSTTLKLNAAPNGDPFGKLEFTVTGWAYHNTAGFNAGVSSDCKFGDSIVVSNDTSTLVVSAPGFTKVDTGTGVVTTQVGRVFVYKNNSGNFTLHETITGTDPLFGNSISISNSGEYLAISSILFDNTEIDEGVVFVYKKGTTYQATSPVKIKNINPERSELFGTKISFMNNYKTLVVYSAAADSNTKWILNDNTTFDDSTTTFYLANSIDNGRIDIYDQYANTWVYGESLTSSTTTADGYGLSFAVGANVIFVSAPYAMYNSVKSGRIFNYFKTDNTYNWSVIHTETEKIDLTKIKSAFLYNRVTNKLIEYLDVVDPVQGKIPGPAEQEIKFKTFYDPAVYSQGDSTVNVDDGIAWKKAQVGMLWWDLRTAKFIDSSVADDPVYRNSTWNSLFPYASIDVYEWVQSKLLPAEWNKAADTEAGLAQGISGTTLYGNTVYSVTKKYDTVAKTFKNTYYYWVKNKKTIPNVSDRHMSAQDVANLISNTRGTGYRYLALTSSNSFSLVNAKNLLQDKDVVLSVEYWIADHQNQNIHSQWKVISDNIDTTLPATIEQKWFDSLCGKDLAGRLVPDPALPPKIKYGVENRPRQGMFVNRFEALKQFFERVNRVLITEQIAGQKNFNKLDSYEIEPSLITGLYDAVLDTDSELRFANTGSFTAPTLTSIVSNGAIVGVNVVDSGRGYSVAPYVTVIGSGTGAKIRTIINSKGQITGATIISSGYGYKDTTSLSVRSYSVLVRADAQALDSWSIYSYSPSTKVWSRLRSQSYDTRKYWAYVDWYATGYSKYSVIDHSVETFADLNSISLDIGQTVKIRTTSSGTWFILEKYANSASIDWTQSYKVVAQENGTIQFDASLYSFSNTAYGFDGSTFDGAIYDNSASTELRNIITTLRDNILTDTLKQTYLDLFFASVRYAMSEQTYLDWIFKTSFVKARHNVGELHQPSNYKNDNLPDFENYIAEVKPYRTQIREYVSTYNKVDTSPTLITDFDLQPAYESNGITVVNANVIDDQIVYNDVVIDTYPWKNWLDNVSYKIASLEIIDNGSNYHMEPTVRFVSNSGSGAKARAFISNGKVNRIILLDPGSGYLSAPTVLLEGGLNPDGTPARAVAIIGNGAVRSQLIKMKFDRITRTYFITQLEETETFTGTGSKLQFSLQWAPDLRIGKSVVTVDGIDVLRDEYKLTKVKSTSKGYTSYSGSLILDSAPAKNSTISVTYLKDWSLLNAADRIQYYYNPTTGELGKDLAQLMTGVDYGGVIVDGLGFDVSQGWDSVPYFSERWDSVDPTFDDYIVTVSSTSSHTFTLPYVPTAGTRLNVYHIKLNTESYLSNGTDLSYDYNIDDISPKISVTRTVTTAGVAKNYVSAGSSGNTLKVSNTTGIVPGMRVVGTEFTTQTVTNVIDGSTLILSAAPSLPPANGITLYFTVNIAGVDTLTLSSTVGLAVGDVVTTSTNGVLGLNTTVKQIVNGTQVKLDQILYGTVVGGTNMVFTRQLVKQFDFTLNNLIGTATLTQPAPSGSYVNIYSTLPAIRLDDPAYGTQGQTNADAIMSTVIANGTSDQVSIPGGYTFSNNDQIIIRKSTSDGSIKPLEADYDTALTGGDLAYSSATGLRAEDIIVDGDGFVTPTTSPATEEVVPGQVFDTMAIKVFDKPYSASANIKIDSYIADGTRTRFALSQIPNSKQAVIVKVTNTNSSVIKTVGTDYTVDYQNNEIVFATAPSANVIVSVFSFGFSGENILDIDYFVGNGATLEFITKAPWIKNLTAVVYVNGNPSISEVFKTDSTYESPNRVGIRFATAPASEDLITFVIVAGLEQSFPLTKTERIATNGSSTYNLSNKVGDLLPLESNMLVRVDQTILKGPTNSYYTIKSNRLNYTIDKDRFAPYSLDINDIYVFADGNLLTIGTDYIVDLSVISIKITKRIYDLYKNKNLIINIKQDQGYTYIPPTGVYGPRITFSQAYDNTHVVEVISSYQHDIFDIQRTNLTVSNSLSITPDTFEYYSHVGITGGRIALDRPVVSDSYVWITKNGNLLVPNIDYILNEDRQSIKLTADSYTGDEFQIITYSSNILRAGIAYMQFKDMLNRDHFKRLSLNKQTQLVQPLKYNDLKIVVQDASNFDIPNPSKNRPGIIEIRGERIEYFAIEHDQANDVWILSQLRRATLGTGAPMVHPITSYVQDIGVSETIPYSNNTIVDQFVSDGSDTVSLKFIPSSVDEIEVFVGGYSVDNEWSSAVDYVVGNIVTVGSYTYRCIEAHTSSSSFRNDSSNWQFFIGNIRLKKAPYSVYNVNEAPESPAGDIDFEAEFIVDGETPQITLTTPLKYGTHITVVRRKGVTWDADINVLDDTNKVATFLKATPGIWYVDNNKYENAQQGSSTFDSDAGTLDSINTTLDRG